MTPTSLVPDRIAVIGRGRLGTALATALEPHAAVRLGGRGDPGSDADLVLLCVPDAEIAAAARAVAPGPLVGHCSGATPLAALAPHEALGLHPLMAVTYGSASFAGAAAAVGATTPRALAIAEAVAAALGLAPFTLDDADRPAYHAAASVASNFLVTLEAWAEELLPADRSVLAPLVRATVENWAAQGAKRALTGPIARGDTATVARQRAAVAERTPDRLPLWDALADATSHIARTRTRGSGPTYARGRAMRTLRTVAEVRTALRPARRQERTIGLVATMGALHAGHLALIERAREECDEVVVSLFVNPTQFGDPADLDAYPRDEEQDAILAAEAGADLLFAPGVDVLYPAGFATHVALEGPLVETLEGAHRGPEHFRGVATVVAKLLNIVQPDAAFFGQKDAQQAVVIRRLVADLNLPVRIEVVPTRRDADGLALSSRNVRLGDADRARALALRAALDAAAAAHATGERDAGALTTAARAAMAPFDVEPEYLALVHPESLAPVRSAEEQVLLAVAATVGGVRLIDNQLIGTPRTGRRPVMTQQEHTS